MLAPVSNFAAAKSEVRTNKKNNDNERIFQEPRTL